MTKLLKLSILFSTAVRAVVVVAKLIILGISFLTSFILALRVVLVAKLVISGILSSIFLFLAFYTSFFKDIKFKTSLSLLKSIGTGTNLWTSSLSILLSNCLNYLAHFSIFQYLIYLH